MSPSRAGRRGNLRLVERDREVDDALNSSAVHVREARGEEAAERDLWAAVAEIGDDGAGAEIDDAELVARALDEDRRDRSPVRSAMHAIARALGIDGDAKSD